MQTETLTLDDLNRRLSDIEFTARDTLNDADALRFARTVELAGDAIRRDRVTDWRVREGATWEQVADRLGVTRSAAHQRYHISILGWCDNATTSPHAKPEARDAARAYLERLGESVRDANG